MPKLDLNSPEFQSQLFRLEKKEQLAVLATLSRLATKSWDEVYRDRGLNMEAIHMARREGKPKTYSLRITKKMRAVVLRNGEYMEFLTLHPNHDSAYQ